MKETGQRLKVLREERGKSQGDIIYYLENHGIENVSKQTISAIENGKQYPSLKILTQLANYYDVSTDFILGRIPYEADRDRQFEQFMLMYRKAMQGQPWIVREYFYTSISEVYWILTQLIERDNKKGMAQFSEMLSRLRVIIYKATDLLDIKTSDVNNLLTSFKYLHSETSDVLKEMASLIDNLAIPFENLPKVSEFKDFADKFSKQSFDEE